MGGFSIKVNSVDFFLIGLAIIVGSVVLAWIANIFLQGISVLIVALGVLFGGLLIVVAFLNLLSVAKKQWRASGE